LALLLPCLAVTTARAAEGGLRILRLTEAQAIYEFLTGFQREAYSFPGSDSPDQVRQSLIFGQRLGAGAKGSFFHPTFWSWSAASNLLLLEDFGYRRIGDGVNGWEGLNADLEFDADSLLLERKPTPVHLFGRRGTAFVHNAFMRSYNVTTTTYGGDTGWQNLAAPVRLSASQTWNSYGGGSVDPGDDVFSQVIADTRYESARHAASAEYRFYDYANREFPTLDYSTHDLLANHTWFALRDASRLHRLDSRVHASRRASFTDREDLQAATTYTAQWFPRFTNRFGYRLNVSQAQDTVYQNLLESTLRYELFESLSFGLLAQGLSVTNDDGQVWQGLGGADVT
jgi:hypothetical protein